MATLWKRGTLEIPLGDPFKADLLDRRRLADTLTKLITPAKDPWVLSLHGPWGSGKTTFLRMWEKDLIRRNRVAVYFNAWENDFVEDPLTAFIGEIDSAFQSEELPLAAMKEARTRERWEKVKEVGGRVLATAGPIGVRLLSQGLVTTADLSKFQDLIQGAGEGVGNLVEEFGERKLAAFVEARQSIVEFKTHLSELAASIQDEDGEKPPIVILVDELDRCRPDFAVALLERIKHLFDVPGVVFVLGINRSQLEETVRAIYGGGMDPEGYLRRFIDLEVQLPPPDQREYIRQLFVMSGMKAELEERGTEWAEKEGFLDSLAAIGDSYSLSLRTLEQLVSRVHLSFRLGKKDERPLLPLLVCLTAARDFVPEAYQAFIAGRIGAETFLGNLEELASGHFSLLTDLRTAQLEALIRLSSLIPKQFEAWHHATKSTLESSPEDEYVRERVMMDLLVGLRYESRSELLPEMSRRIDILSDLGLVIEGAKTAPASVHIKPGGAAKE